ncbi:cobyric acid synthase CobQ, partial [Halorubrum sp. CBA1125]|nr:cobyric acid synthase CobQ [Halorubrum sp. CBA1125]
DAVVLPGSKNTVDDLLALREAGFDDAIRGFDGPVVGLCGGYQILGERLVAADVEGTGSVETVEGVGALPVETRFSREKRVERVRRSVEGVGPIAGATGTATGYEIHMGRSEPVREVCRPLGPESAATDRVLGTYLHGLFENDSVRNAFVDAVFDATDRSRPNGDGSPTDGDDRSPYDRAADLVADNVDLSAVGLDV